MEALPLERVRHCVFDNCTEDALTLCRKCGRWFCLDHASDLDPTKYCIDCLKPEDASLEEHPILDSEGVRHQGKIIRPVGVVFRCERATEYSRITLGNALYEAGDREIAKVNQKTGEVYFPPPKKLHTVKARGASKAKALDENAIADFIAKNLTLEQLQKFMAKAKK